MAEKSDVYIKQPVYGTCFLICFVLAPKKKNWTLFANDFSFTQTLTLLLRTSLFKES